MHGLLINLGTGRQRAARPASGRAVQLVDADLRAGAQVHKFSKFIHGSATLLPDLVQAVPYWVDDESVRPSMLQSAPAPPSCAPCPSSGAWTVA